MAQKEKEEYIRSKLPYEILKRIYKDSRISLRRMGEELGISYHVIKSVLKKLEEEYNIAYEPARVWRLAMETQDKVQQIQSSGERS